MTTVVEMPLDDGGTVLVEVDEEDQRLQRVGVSKVVRGTEETLDEALRRVKPAVTAVLRQVRALATPPEKVTLEFGVKLTAEAGVVIAKAATEANFKLSMEWSVKSEPERDQSAD